MKHFLLLFTLFIMTIPIKAQSFDLNFDHYAINVKDLQRSVDFYGKVLGLSQITNQTQDDNIRWFRIGTNLELHVIQSENAGQVRLVKGVHLALTLTRFDALLTHLDQLGITYSSWPGEEGTFNLRPDGVKQIYLQDPDGYWIEVNDAAAKR